MTNDNRELNAVDPTQVGQIYPYEIEVDYPDGAHTWEKGRMNAQAVATRFRQEAEQIELYGDLPNPVNTAIAAELERLAESIAVTATLGDLIATAEAAARGEVARSLIARAAELKAGA